MPDTPEHALLARVARGETTFACDGLAGAPADEFEALLDAMRELEVRGLVRVRLRNYSRRRRSAGPAVLVATLTALGESLVGLAGAPRALA
jgi:hypothetical protein